MNPYSESAYGIEVQVVEQIYKGMEAHTMTTDDILLALVLFLNAPTPLELREV